MTASRNPQEWAPAACTLPTAERPVRVAEFDDLFAAIRGVHRGGPTALTITLAAAPGRADLARDLARRESECCSFFTFAVHDGDPVRLDVTVPPAHAEVLDALAARAARIGGVAP